MNFLTRNLLKLGSIAGSALLATTALANAALADTAKSNAIREDAALGTEFLAQIPPFENQQIDSIALPADGTLNVTVYNNTGDDVIYRVVGTTDFRYLEDGETTVLRNLELPINFFFDRTSNGLAKASVEVNGEEGEVGITIEPAISGNNDLDSMLINESGDIFLL